MINSHQCIILLLSIIYIYVISDLFVVINDGPSFKLVLRLCIPVLGNILVRTIDQISKYNIDLGYFVKKFNNSIYGTFIINTIDKISKYNVDLCDWWNQPLSTYKGIAYVFKIIKWIHKNNIHLNWDNAVQYMLFVFFVMIIFRIIYNFVMVFEYNFAYLFFSLLCSYSVYMKFSSSSVAFVTILGKCTEMGSSIILSENLHRIDDIKDYCEKNKDTWMTHIIKIVIGYHGNIDIDGEFMSREISEYIGTTYDECKLLYESSIMKKVSSIIEISKSTINKITKRD
jgi:hypothetical protein